MDMIQFREYCLSLDGVTEKMPFGKFAKRYESILVFYVLDHMFCFTDIDDFRYVDIKSTPGEIDDMRIRYSSVGNPINMSQRHWIQIDFGGDISDELIYEKIARAYRIVKEQYSKKKKNSGKSNSQSK